MQELFHYLKVIYKSQAEQAIEPIKELIFSLSPIGNYFDLKRGWARFVELYSIYPDGVIYDKNLSPLRNLVQHIVHVKRLGFNALHIMPFLQSPMVDHGFDVSDYYKIREDLGTMEDLLQLKKTADEANIHILMDLVLNHVSDQHEWFQKAQNGDEKYRKYFITTPKKPNFLRKFHAESAVWAEFKLNGEKVAINVAFPEYSEEIPLWRQGKDGYWYYHTYYPQQIDLNWENPEVFVEMAKIMLYWCRLGFHFRLDAIPFVGKAAYKVTGVRSKKTFYIIAALKYLARLVNPFCAFAAETYEDIDTVIQYFGTCKRHQVDLSYNFHLCTIIWVCLVEQKSSFLWDKIDKLYHIPKHGQWINFLRNHDELSLAHLQQDLVLKVRKEILKYGRDFREGFGISGRTFSLLGKKHEIFQMAYFLLISLPGGIMFPYGDEIAKENIPSTKLLPRQRRDSRNINRGVMVKEELCGENGQFYINYFSKLIHKRRELRQFLKKLPEKINISEQVFAARYRYRGWFLAIYINLSPNRIKIEANMSRLSVQLQVGNVILSKDNFHLDAYSGIWLLGKE